MSIEVKYDASGSAGTMKFLDRMKRNEVLSSLDWAGRRGVQALSAATPRETGQTAESWDYRIIRSRKNGRRIEWFNTNEKNGAIIAVLVQYGHGTGDGTWVEGKDYINPAMTPVFEEIADQIWKQVKA